MATSHKPFLRLSRFAYLALRAIQILLSLTILILYTTTLSKHPEDPSSYIYAIICSTVTLLTLAIYSLPTFPTRNFFLWDFVLAVLWAALAGVFGMIYLEEDNAGDRIEGSKNIMKSAVACDLVVMVCWVVTAVWGCLGYCKAAVQARRARKEGKEADKMLEGQERGFVEMERENDGEREKGLVREKMEAKCAKV